MTEPAAMFTPEQIADIQKRASEVTASQICYLTGKLCQARIALIEGNSDAWEKYKPICGSEFTPHEARTANILQNILFEMSRIMEADSTLKAEDLVRGWGIMAESTATPDSIKPVYDQLYYYATAAMCIELNANISVTPVFEDLGELARTLHVWKRLLDLSTKKVQSVEQELIQLPKKKQDEKRMRHAAMMLSSQSEIGLLIEAALALTRQQ